jgi:uncharacterized protein
VTTSNEDLSPVITAGLIAAIRARYRLRWNGLHGYQHWARVRENGLRLAGINGADKTIVELFAFLHDSARNDDGRDGDHGKRAVEVIRALHGRYFSLSADDLARQEYACAYHTFTRPDNARTSDLTIFTCWDADRLDIGRVGSEIKPGLLFTAAAREPEIMRWAYERSLSAW